MKAGNSIIISIIGVFFIAVNPVAASNDAKTFTLKCTYSESKTEHGHEGSYMHEVKYHNDYRPTFLNINLASMSASEYGEEFTVTATPEAITLVKGSTSTADIEPYERYIIQRDSLQFESILYSESRFGPYTSESKGVCIKAPTSSSRNQI